MRLAIVGTSRLSECEELDARKLIALLIKDYLRDYTNVRVISGGAKGIDSIAEQVAKGLGITSIIFKPAEKNWDAYKTRNIKIASDCDELICITTKLKDEVCYHCNDPTHQRTGGCYTMKITKSLKKPTKLYVL